MFWVLPFLGESASEVLMLTVTSRTFLSIANTVTGSVNCSPGASFRGSEAKTISGLRTGVVASALP